MKNKKIKKVIFFFIMLVFSATVKTYADEVSIKVFVDDQIITNVDINKEKEYLKILNPQLKNINDTQISILAKKTLINEIIKKKEIEKYLDLDKENSLTDEQLINLYSKLNFKNKDDFGKFLKNKNSFTLKEIKTKIQIELLWNELIYTKYINQVKIDTKSIISFVNNLEENNQKEYLLSEIVFKKNKENSFDELVNKIKFSIEEIGFNNTASLYSISESANIGGKLDWVSEGSLSNYIQEKVKQINVGDYTDVIKVGNNFTILKLNEIRINKIKIDREKKINDIIKTNTNNQLSQFSKIYFDKLKMNYSINEK
jgi:peptidyl-prolyl cis-trans isomerase SurA